MYSYYLQGSSKNNLTQITELWTIVEHLVWYKNCVNMCMYNMYSIFWKSYNIIYILL